MSEQTRNSSERDILSEVFGSHYPRGDVFFSGVLCGTSHHKGRDDQPEEQQGMLHVLQSGSVRILLNGKEHVKLDRPGVVLLGKPIPHEIETPESGSNLVCAYLQFPNPGPTPARLGLPGCLVLPFDEVPGLEPVTGQLFLEAFAHQPGKRTAVNLLVDLLLLMLLRHCHDRKLVQPGILAAMRDQRIARVVGELHLNPGKNWSVESQAEIAGMSRASFAALFRDLLGTSPGDFLQSIRLEQAFAMLREGKNLQSVADLVGYRSTTALARAIQQKHNISPRALRQDSSAGN
ncbi:cupin domain-containing protein [Thalassospira lucentensis]|uniref:cupin domain-containing protein n=1 Tax=Thalassospira lucentensis TaxID=168935 RepID=UPI003D2ECDF2